MFWTHLGEDHNVSKRAQNSAKRKTTWIFIFCFWLFLSKEICKFGKSVEFFNGLLSLEWNTRKARLAKNEKKGKKND